MKKKETGRCAYSIMAGKVPIFLEPIHVIFSWIEPNMKRDPDNICAGAKFILDALVELGRIPNDTRRWVKEISHQFLDPQKNARVIITIESMSVS